MIDDVLLLSDDVSDDIRFTGNFARRRYSDISVRNAIGERTLVERCFSKKELAWIYQRGWKELATVERPCNISWCHEMLANLRRGDDDDEASFMTHFRGTELLITASMVMDFLGIPERKEEVMVPDGYEAMEFVDTRFEFVTPGAGRSKNVL